jgi:hypothetical protein
VCHFDDVDDGPQLLHQGKHKLKQRSLGPKVSLKHRSCGIDVASMDSCMGWFV